MTRMAVITKSFAPDFELCAALNKSVLDNSPDTVQHHIIVPRSDLKLFGRLAGPRTQIRCEADLLPRMFVRVPFVNITVNLSRPFPPVRGWIQQQVVKLAAIAVSEDDSVCLVYWEDTPLTLDSAARFIRGVRPTDVAAVIQSKSRTPLAVREAAFAALRAAHNTAHRSEGPSDDR